MGLEGRGGGRYGRGRRDAGGQVGREGGKADNHMGGREGGGGGGGGEEG